MNIYAHKTRENNSRSVANAVSQKKRCNTLGFPDADNRLKPVAQRNANNNLRVSPIDPGQEAWVLQQPPRIAQYHTWQSVSRQGPPLNRTGAVCQLVTDFATYANGKRDSGTKLKKKFIGQEIIGKVVPTASRAAAGLFVNNHMSDYLDTDPNVTQAEWDALGDVLIHYPTLHARLVAFDAHMAALHYNKPAHIPQYLWDDLMAINATYNETDLDTLLVPVAANIANYVNIHWNDWQTNTSRMESILAYQSPIGVNPAPPPALTDPQKRGKRTAEIQATQGLGVGTKNKLYLTNVTDTDTYMNSKRWDSTKVDVKKKRLLAVDGTEWSFQANQSWLQKAITTRGTFKVLSALPADFHADLIGRKFNNGAALIEYVINKNKAAFVPAYRPLWDNTTHPNRPRVMAWEMASLIDSGYKPEARGNPLAPIQFVPPGGKARDNTLGTEMHKFVLNPNGGLQI